MHSDRIADLESLQAALGSRVGEPWRVEEAKSKLTKLISRCRDGNVELIGVQGEPVLMMSYDELTRIVRRLNGPRTWGELFESLPALPSDELTLRPGIDAAPIDLEGDEEGSKRSVA